MKRFSLPRNSLGENLIASGSLDEYLMPMQKCSYPLKIALGLLLALIVVCPQISTAQDREFSPPLKAAQLMGLKVEDTDGRTVGIVRNLIIDTRSGQTRYAVIASGGFMGVGSSVRLAPSAIMSAATTKREILSINTTLAQWRGAPAFRPSQLATLAAPAHAKEIARYFGKSESRTTGTPGLSLSATGASASTVTNMRPDMLKFASDLMGKTVVNRQRQKIGEVMDLLVGFGEPHPAFAIISTGKFLWHGQQYAIPLATLNFTEDGRKLMAEADSAALQEAPPFNQQVWETVDLTAKPGIYRYSKGGE